MRLRLLALAAVGAVGLTPIGASAQYFGITTSPVYRCAGWNGPVSGGFASVGVCFGIGPDVYGDLPGVPGADPETGYYACLYLRKPLTVSAHSVCGEPKFPGAPVPVPHPAPFIMDPAMQQATIEFELVGGCGKISTRLTLTGTGTPEPGQGMSAMFDEWNGDLFVYSGAGAGVDRGATSSGTITSACRGTATLSGANGGMYQGTGASLFVSSY